jgi:DUF1680 family protein
MERYVDHIAATFGTGTGQKRGNPGQQEIELALDKLPPPRRPSAVRPALSTSWLSRRFVQRLSGSRSCTNSCGRRRAITIPRNAHGFTVQVFWGSDVGKWIEAAS